MLRRKDFEPSPNDPRAAKNVRLAIVCGVIFCGMVGSAFAFVPLYRAFCQATGFAGTVRRAYAPPTSVSDRSVEVDFNTNVRGLAWDFEPNVPNQTARLGDSKLAFFKVTNNSNAPLTGRAVYNVTPESAGGYFSKLECFCFTNQTLQPHQTAEFPVVYYVDPRFGTDDDTREIKVITLSYTFYPAKPLANRAQGDSTAPARPG
jgi:cytochrome c oxidase assembly protein subunit 11